MTAVTDRGEPSLTLGYIGILLAVAIWAGWIVSTRDSVLMEHTPFDIAVVRYVAPALLLSPYWIRKGVFPKGESPLLLVIMTVGWGGPFVMLIAQGMKTVEASLFGPLVPGLLPMVVAVWGVAVEGERLRPGRLLGLCFIAMAVALILGPALAGADNGVLIGAPWLLLACIGWSSFTIAFRHTGLSGAESAAYVCLYSSPFLIAAAMVFGTDLFDYPPIEVGYLILVQGVLSGALSVACFGYAVKTLGLGRASAFTSLVPVLAAIGGWLMLGETVGLAGWAASAAACIGVLLVNRYAV
ncbi:DMT family transporter [Pikeienuella piscinae]|uniref:DMT family transporter n=1 Tax=Pikeienuella piscinae TaxID=2748098 RepID=A0A7L5BU59_9RHOB|nr:DMT family transporter [Pikeienuella piscinae]QIE54168.1 DMT family transporter [Pikeienuella piscinae]